MDKLIIIVTLLTIILNPLTSQIPSSTYKGEDNRLYINKEEGIFIWISTSPDENSEKIRLMSDTSCQYTNPMYFDTEGYNTVRSPSAVDTSTKKVVLPLHDIIFEVYVDGLSPATNISFPGATSKIIDGNLFLGGEFKIKLTSKDAVSGISNTYFMLNGNDFKPFTQEFDITKEGKTSISYYSIDNVGNKEEVQTKDFYIDKTPPVTSYEFQGAVKENYVSSDARIVLLASDNLSGVSAIYYKINNGQNRRYTRPIPVSYMANNGVISYYAVDKIGNKEKVMRIGSKEGEVKKQDNEGGDGLLFAFYVDKEPPSVKIIHEGDYYKGKYKYVSSKTRFIINCEDEKSGVDKVYYSLNSTIVDNQYKDPFNLSDKGLFYIRAKAVDFVSNTSSTNVEPYFCDTDPPKSSLIFGKPLYKGKDTIFISSTTKVQIRSTDTNSGVQKIMFAMNSGKLKDYKDEFTFQQQGMQTIDFQAIDNVNNQETKQTKSIFVDNTPPEIYYHFSTTSIGKKNVRDENYMIYPTDMQLYIAATDMEAGGEFIEYRINNGTFQKVIPIQGMKAGNYEVEIKAYDVLGNASTKTVKFALED